MPVEIKELVIRAVISQAPDPGGRTVSLGDGSGGARREALALDHETLVREAVKEVLRILKAAKER